MDLILLEPYASTPASPRDLFAPNYNLDSGEEDDREKVDVSSVLFLLGVFVFVFLMAMLKLCLYEIPRNRQRRASYWDRRDYIRHSLVSKTVLKKQETVDVEQGKDVKDDDQEKQSKEEKTNPCKAETKPQEKPEYLRQKTNLVLTSVEHGDEDEDLDMTCPICLLEFEVGDKIYWSRNPLCNHTFHTACIEQWLMRHDRCPCCRNDYLVPPPVGEEESSEGFHGRRCMLPISHYLGAIAGVLIRPSLLRQRRRENNSAAPTSQEAPPGVTERPPSATDIRNNNSNEPIDLENPADIIEV